MTAPQALGMTLSIAIPTYRREAVLIDTIHMLMRLEFPAVEIIVIDQTERHDSVTTETLSALAGAGNICWIRQCEPSIPKAMNRGLLEARSDIVLFLDDDIRPELSLLRAHVRAHTLYGDVLIAGRVIQPWQEGKDFSTERDFHFACSTAQLVDEFIGCNFSVRRDAALALGGFDENFVRVAYRYEAEFAHRFRASGRAIWFEPDACVHHLKDAGGGTRAYGEHLTTWRPDHAVGAYYFALRTKHWREIATRPLSAITTRFHLRRPWKIVSTLIAEARGLVWAIRLYLRGPSTISHAGAAEKR